MQENLAHIDAASRAKRSTQIHLERQRPLLIALIASTNSLTRQPSTPSTRKAPSYSTSVSPLREVSLQHPAHGDYGHLHHAHSVLPRISAKGIAVRAIEIYLKGSCLSARCSSVQPTKENREEGHRAWHQFQLDAAISYETQVPRERRPYEATVPTKRRDSLYPLDLEGPRILL